jgi:peroxiredoxin Q/BCP
MASLALGLLLLLLAPGAIAEELVVGSEAPPFSLVGSDGRTHTLADGVVLAWFPKAFTPG